jgi:hypothetical protein
MQCHADFVIYKKINDFVITQKSNNDHSNWFGELWSAYDLVEVDFANRATCSAARLVVPGVSDTATHLQTGLPTVSTRRLASQPVGVRQSGNGVRSAADVLRHSPNKRTGSVWIHALAGCPECCTKSMCEPEAAAQLTFGISVEKVGQCDFLPLAVDDNEVRFFVESLAAQASEIPVEI